MLVPTSVQNFLGFEMPEQNVHKRPFICRITYMAMRRKIKNLYEIKCDFCKNLLTIINGKKTTISN